MKKMLFRKLLLDYMSFFLIALFSSTLVIWVFQSVNYLDIMIEDGRDYKVYINYSLLNFPKILNKLFPFILFFSLFQILSRYENNNELIIFWSFGITKIELVNFILKFSIILMLVQILFSIFVVPKTQDLAKSIIRSSTINFYENFIKPKRFNDTIKNVTIYSEKKDVNGNLYNLYLKKQISQKKFEIIYAKKGNFKEINSAPVLVLYNGVRIVNTNDKVTNFTFSKSDFLLKNLTSNTSTYKKTQELSTLNLVKCIFIRGSTENIKELNIENCSQNNFKNINQEIYKRFIIPFYIPLLVFIPLIITLSSKESSNYFKIKIITFLLGIFFIIFSETSIKMISDVNSINMIISIIPILIVFTFYGIYSKKTNFNFSNK